MEKKTLRAAERHREDVAVQREEWQKLQKTFDITRLVFIDETWTKTNMTPLRGRAERGKRVIDYVPHGHWKTTTFLAALSGYACGTSSKDRLPFILHKISDDVCIQSEECMHTFIQEALKFCQFDTGFHPRSSHGVARVNDGEQQNPEQASQNKVSKENPT